MLTNFSKLSFLNFESQTEDSPHLTNVKEELLQIDLSNTTPINALLKLQELKEYVSEGLPN